MVGSKLFGQGVNAHAHGLGGGVLSQLLRWLKALGRKKRETKSPGKKKQTRLDWAGSRPLATAWTGP